MYFLYTIWTSEYTFNYTTCLSYFEFHYFKNTREQWVFKRPKSVPGNRFGPRNSPLKRRPGTGPNAYQASVRWQDHTGRPLHARDFHALDWLLDAYLRLSRFEDAKRLMDELDKIELEIRRRGEEWGEFPNIAGQLREYYRGAVPDG